MTTRTINISVVEQVPQERKIYFIPVLTSDDGDLLLEEQYNVTTDEDGVATIDLPVKDSGNIRYNYELPGNDGTSLGYFLLAAGDPIDLGDLLVAGDVASDSVQQYVDAAIAEALDEIGGGGASGTAGGVLAGTYPNPSFAADMATQTELDAVAAAAVLKTGDQSVAGIKTFDSSPIVPIPTTDYQVAAKKYVDDRVVSVGESYLNVVDYGALGDGVTDDYAAIMAAIAAAEAGRIKTIYFPCPSGYYKFATPLDLTGTTGLTLLGNIGNRIWQDYNGLTPRLVYSGTAAAAILTAQSEGLSIIGLACQYSNAAFRGDVLTTGNYPSGGKQTLATLISDCFFGGINSSIHLGRSGIHLGGAVQAHIQRCFFQWADYGIIGALATDPEPFCTATTIGPNNWFDRLNLCGIAPSGAQQMTICYNVFEPLYPDYATGLAGGIITGILGSGGVYNGLTIVGNGFWDAAGSGGTWISLYGRSINIQGNYFDCRSHSTAIAFPVGAVDVTISGNNVTGSAGATFVNAGLPVSGYNEFGNTVDSGITQYTIPSFVQFASQTVKYLTANGSARFLGYTSSAAVPTTTELPNSLDWCLHNNTTGPTIYLAFNIGGVIKKVALS